MLHDIYDVLIMDVIGARRSSRNTYEFNMTDINGGIFHHEIIDRDTNNRGSMVKTMIIFIHEKSFGRVVNSKVYDRECLLTRLYHGNPVWACPLENFRTGKLFTQVRLGYDEDSSYELPTGLFDIKTNFGCIASEENSLMAEIVFPASYTYTLVR